jgi:hypothetical protein
MALTAATQEAMFIKQMLHEFYKDSGSAITIHENNQGCIALSKNSMTTGRSKHMDVRYHFNREKVESGDIEVQYSATEIMLTHVLTKRVQGKAICAMPSRACLRRKGEC